MNEEKKYLTKEKYEEFEKELDHLKHQKRKEVAENLEYAKSLGDLSENAEYHEARELQATVEDRINRIEALLKSAEIVKGHSVDSVSVGSTVTVCLSGQKDKQDYTIVGSEEADMTSGKISRTSPFGEAIMDKKKGESFSFKAPNGKSLEYKILAIS